ncbi:MAG: methyltransferase domain-containing protein, partial [Mariprofundaceae bacterium]|nr:methyltransferase domain-containing protein [Mariprofundaceae bacterium]
EDVAGSFLGFHSRSSHRVIRAGRCAVVHPDMDALRLRIESLLPPMIQSVRMIRLYDGMHVVFETGEGVDVPAAEVFSDCLDVIRQTELSIQPWLRAGVVLRPLIKPVKILHDYLPAGEEWVELTVGPEDFVQGHAAGNVHILRQIQAWAGMPKRIADLFCGIGNLSLPLAVSCGATVIGADVAESSIRAAKANAKSLGVKARFQALNLFDGLGLKFDSGEHYAGADVLLLDPPRKGAKAICKAMGRLMPEKIIMVNCDIAAGARDAEILTAQGYRMQALRALDIFPFSGHVEAMSCWSFHG